MFTGAALQPLTNTGTSSRRRYKYGIRRNAFSEFRELLYWAVWNARVSDGTRDLRPLQLRRYDLQLFESSLSNSALIFFMLCIAFQSEQSVKSVLNSLPFLNMETGHVAELLKASRDFRAGVSDASRHFCVLQFNERGARYRSTHSSLSYSAIEGEAV